MIPLVNLLKQGYQIGAHDMYWLTGIEKTVLKYKMRNIIKSIWKIFWQWRDIKNQVSTFNRKADEI